ncbi:MAG TPA: hypothetical protein VK901_15480 [Nitrospiraceae bacterium]|nr:hypothetical protein [Nitrospiraceae bacterium]
MIGAICLSVKQIEWHRLQPPRAALLGIFIFDMQTQLEIAVLIGYLLSLWFLYCLAIKPDISFPFFSLICTNVIVAPHFLSPPGMQAFILAMNRTMGAALPLTPGRQRILHTTS